MEFFNIATTAFTAFGYPVSHIEWIAVLFGLVSVYYASRVNIATWPTGIVNEFFLFLLFFQLQLYADMFLQVYFFIVTLWGWHNWRAGANEKRIAVLSWKIRWLLFLIIVTGTLVSGFVFANIHVYLPEYFKVEASFPFADSFIMMASIVATILLAKRKIENWCLWISVDSVCVILYYAKGVIFLSLEYLIFLILASYGLYHWRKQQKND